MKLYAIIDNIMYSIRRIYTQYDITQLHYTQLYITQHRYTQLFVFITMKKYEKYNQKYENKVPKYTQHHYTQLGITQHRYTQLCITQYRYTQLDKE